MPRAERPLVLLVQRADEYRCLRLRLARAGDGEDARDRVALVRHRGRRAALRLRDLADLVLAQQPDVESDLRGRAGGDADRRAELGDAHAVRVPGGDGVGEVEALREEPRHLQPLPTERGQRSDGTAELGREALVPDADKCLAGLEKTEEPHGGLEPECGRLRLLEQRPADHQGRAVRLGEPGTHFGERVEGVEDDAQCGARDDHRRAVEDVLARRALVDVLGGVTTDRLP
jgi:hypothetical protein